MKPLANIDITLGWRRLPCQDVVEQVSALGSGVGRERARRVFKRECSPKQQALMAHRRQQKERFWQAFLAVYQAQGMTRKKLAMVLDVYDWVVDKWFRGGAFPSRETGVKINTLFGLGFDDLGFLAKGNRNGNDAN